MDTNVFKAIIFDLHIDKFPDEDDISFHGRIVYTALAAWCRNMMNDKSFTDINTTGTTGVDIEHVNYHLINVADSMFDVFPYSQPYFKTEKYKDITDMTMSLIKNMLFSYECSRTLEDRRLIQTPATTISFPKSGVLMLGGTQYKSNGKLSFVGCGKWLINTIQDTDYEYHRFWGIPSDSTTYISSLETHAEWSNVDIIDDSYYIFDVTAKNVSKFETCWRRCEKGVNRKELSVLKKDNRFYPLKSDEDELLISELNKWYSDQNEVLRILYALKKRYGVPHKIKAGIMNNHVNVNINSELPNAELRILLLSSWGLRNAYDRYNRIIPIKTWEYVKSIFIDLGCEIINI